METLQPGSGYLVQTHLCTLHCTWVLDKKSIKVSAASMTAISFSFNEFGAFFAYPAQCSVAIQVVEFSSGGVQSWLKINIPKGNY